MTTNPNGIGDAGETTGSALSLVAEPSSEALSTPQVAQRLQRSVAWVKKHGRELGGAIVNGAWTFPSVEIERRRTTVTTSERLTLGARATPEPPNVGERAAAVFAALEAGRQFHEIIISLRESPEFVKRMRAEWIEGHNRLDREGLAFHCRCGAPSVPSCALCARCAARMRTLTDAEAAALDGREMPPPETCGCTGCGAVVDLRLADHVCAACAPKIAVALTSGRLVVTLGSTVLRELTPEETQRLLAPVVASSPAAGTLAPVLPPTAPATGAADGGVLSIRDALEQARAQRIASEKRLAETQARLAALDEQEEAG